MFQSYLYLSIVFFVCVCVCVFGIHSCLFDFSIQHHTHTHTHTPTMPFIECMEKKRKSEKNDDDDDSFIIRFQFIACQHTRCIYEFQFNSGVSAQIMQRYSDILVVYRNGAKTMAMGRTERERKKRQSMVLKYTFTKKKKNA